MATTVKLTVRQIIEAHRGLNQLDAVRSGKDEIIPLEFTGVTRAKLMVNSVEFERVKLAHDAADRALAKQHGVFNGMDKNAENGAKLDAYERAVQEALDIEREVSVEIIKLSALLNRPGDGKTIKLNPVPQSVLNRLAPILEFDASEG